MSTPTSPRIGYLPYELFHVYWATSLQGVKQRSAELGIRLVLPSVSPDDNIAAAVDELLRQRIDCVIVPGNLIVVDDYSFTAFNAASIPVIVTEFAPMPSFVCAVHSNELQGAETILDYLAQRIGGAGKIAHLTGGQTMRSAALRRLLERQPAIELAFDAQGPWSREWAAQMMQEALATNTDLCGVFAQNDQLALGAIDTIEALGYSDRIVVIGFDGTPDGLAAIYRGKLAATVYRSTYTVGRVAVDMAMQAASGATPPREVQTESILITPANIVEATLDSMTLLPLILQDLLESNKAQRQLQEQIIAAQQSMIQELSTPIIPISPTISVLPLIGTIDSARARMIMDTLLASVSTHRTKIVIIDISGVVVVDTGTAHYLLQSARGAQLLGAQVVLVGIGPEVAQTIVQLGVDLSDIPTYSTLQYGLEYARRKTQDRRPKTEDPRPKTEVPGVKGTPESEEDRRPKTEV
jgi:ABC-type sugar transport system substrate-binding protein/anti-anti-sigma regulatory factor